MSRVSRRRLLSTLLVVDAQPRTLKPLFCIWLFLSKILKLVASNTCPGIYPVFVPTLKLGLEYCRTFIMEKVKLCESSIATQTHVDSGCDPQISLTAESPEREEHLLCPRINYLSTPLPTRVLDIGVEESAVVRLVESHGRLGKYMTLSHCWGKDGARGMFTTTRDSLNQRRFGMHFSELPATFRDAIKLTRALDVRYLWIDSLCIIQGDKVDWEAESGRMGVVYSNSYLNIAATNSRNSQGGLFRFHTESSQSSSCHSTKSLIPTGSKKIEAVSGSTANVFVRKARTTSHSDFDTRMALQIGTQSPLLTRAWVLQERLLSPRTVHFHREEMVWECASAANCECTELSIHNDNTWNLFWDLSANLRYAYSALSRDSLPAREKGFIWMDIVEYYTSLALTEPLDILPALSGLARQLSHGLQSSYLAGLWEMNLVTELVWYRWNPKKVVGASRSPRILRSAPSWSWASMSWPDGVHVRCLTHRFANLNQDPRFHLVAVDCNPATGDQFGRVADGRLTIKCAAIVADLQPYSSRDSTWRIRLKGDGRGSAWISPWMYPSRWKLVLEVDEPCTIETSISEVFCALLSTRHAGSDPRLDEFNQGLILESTREGDGLCQRIGAFEVPANLRWFEDAKVVGFKII